MCLPRLQAVEPFRQLLILLPQGLHIIAQLLHVISLFAAAADSVLDNFCKDTDPCDGTVWYGILAMTASPRASESGYEHRVRRQGGKEYEGREALCQPCWSRQRSYSGFPCRN